MASLYITEFAQCGRELNGTQLMTPMEPPVAEQKIAIGATSAASALFNAATRVVRLHADAICSVAFGAATPAATVANMRLAAGQTEYFTIPAGSALMVANITNT